MKVVGVCFPVFSFQQKEMTLPGMLHGLPLETVCWFFGFVFVLAPAEGRHHVGITLLGESHCEDALKNYRNALE